MVGVDPAAGTLDLREVAGLEVIAGPYHAALLEGASLVIAAGPEDVNARVVADARRIGVWACSASDPGSGDFQVPAVWRSGPLVVTVSTSGASPALAAVLRDQAAQALGPAAAGLAAVFAELRPVVLDRVADPVARRRLLRDWANPRWISLWTEHGSEAVRQAVLQCIEENRS